MLRKLAYTIGGAVVLAAGVYGYLRYSAKGESRTVDQLLPEGALWVYHSSQLPTDLARLNETSLGQLIASFPDIQPVIVGLQHVDSTALISWLEDRSCYVACQITGNDDLGFSFYLELNSPTDADNWKNMLRAGAADSGWQIENRQYQGITIEEWVYPPEQLRFSWLRIANFIVGSFTPFLVEDQIRRRENIEVPKTSWRKGLFQNTLSQRDQGDIYVNGDQLSTLLEVFQADKVREENVRFNALCQSMLLDLSVENDQWLLSGFSEVDSSSVNGSNQYFLTTFNNQSARPFQLGSYMPNRAAKVREWSFSSASDWIKQYAEYRRRGKYSTQFQQLSQQFIDESGMPLGSWFEWAGGEFGVVELETTSGTTAEKLVVLEIRNLEEMNRALEPFVKASDSLSFQESFAGYTLRNLTNSVLPAIILGESDSGSFSECFWFHDSTYLVLSNSVNALKRLISDKTTENTWSKSAQQARFLERSLDPANFSILVNMPRFRERWKDNLSTKWAQWAEENKAKVNKLEKIAVQFSAMEEEYYTSIVITNQPQELATSSGFSTLHRVKVDTLLDSKPFVVRNQTNQQLETLVQDKNRVVHFLSPTNQSVLWSDSLSTGIAGEVFSVNISNKQHYLFATDSVLHLVDHNGNDAPGYPLYLPDSVRVQYLSVFDYEQNGEYRFLVTDLRGKLWLYNADRDNLPGWNPLSLTAPLAEAPQHFRVRGKDCIIALQQDGLLYLLNRRGEPYSGFPIDLGQSCRNPVFVEIGNSFTTTKLSTVTDQGELLSLNLTGELVLREQLLRTSSNTHFILCPDRLGKSFVLVRQDDQRLSVLDDQGEIWFEQSYFTPGGLARAELAIQYYNFATDNQIIAITDKIQEFTYLFDQKGKLLNDRPIESTSEVGLLYSEANSQYRLYRVYDNELSVITF